MSNYFNILTILGYGQPPPQFGGYYSSASSYGAGQAAVPGYSPYTSGVGGIGGSYAGSQRVSAEMQYTDRSMDVPEFYQSAVKVRKEFPETWIWETISNDR